LIRSFARRENAQVAELSARLSGRYGVLAQPYQALATTLDDAGKFRRFGRALHLCGFEGRVADPASLTNIPVVGKNSGLRLEPDVPKTEIEGSLLDVASVCFSAMNL
jgi:hypothetical protein